MIELAADGAHRLSNLFRSGQADRVRQRHRADAHVGDVLHRRQQFVNLPHIAVRVANGHADISHQVEPLLLGLAPNGFQLVAVFFRRLILVLA